MNNTLLNNPLPKLALYKECTGCFACVAVCPKDAIEALVNDEGHYAIRVKQEKCVHCGKCEITCNNAITTFFCFTKEPPSVMIRTTEYVIDASVS